jgi:hypothetical protein
MVRNRILRNLAIVSCFIGPGIMFHGPDIMFHGAGVMFHGPGIMVHGPGFIDQVSCFIDQVSYFNAYYSQIIHRFPPFFYAAIAPKWTDPIFYFF